MKGASNPFLDAWTKIVGTSRSELSFYYVKLFYLLRVKHQSLNLRVYNLFPWKYLSQSLPQLAQGLQLIDHVVVDRVGPIGLVERQ